MRTFPAFRTIPTLLAFATLALLLLITGCKVQSGHPAHPPQSAPIQAEPTSRTFPVKSCEDVQDGSKCVYADDDNLWYFPDGIHNLDELNKLYNSGIPATWCKDGPSMICVTIAENGDMSVTLTDK